MSKTKVKLNKDFHRDKLSLTSGYDSEDEDAPRKGILYKNEEYVVDESDRIVKHFIEGGTFVKVDDEEIDSEESFQDKLEAISYIGEERAKKIAQDYENYKDLKTSEDLIQYFSKMDGIGNKRAEEIVKNIKEE